MKMSRSARNRVSRNARTQPAPRGTVAPRAARLTRSEQAHQNSTAGIRAVGYLGRNPTRVHYSGSGDAGYRSEWTGRMDFYTDPRWSQTVTNQN